MHNITYIHTLDPKKLFMAYFHPAPASDFYCVLKPQDNFPFYRILLARKLSQTFHLRLKSLGSLFWKTTQNAKSCWFARQSWCFQNIPSMTFHLLWKITQVSCGCQGAHLRSTEAAYQCFINAPNYVFSANSHPLDVTEGHYILSDTRCQLIGEPFNLTP